MIDYKKLYTLLFNGITDGIRQMEEHNYGLAKKTLILAQVEAEQLYLLQEEEAEQETTKEA